MNKILKYVLIVVSALLLIVVAAAFYVAATFDPNSYKPRVIEIVKEKTGRNLAIPGDIRLSFFPQLGAKLGEVSLSEHRSEKEFASVEAMRVSLALMPLLSRRAEVDEIYVKGLRASIVRKADGTLSIDDLLQGQGAKPGEAKPAAAGPAFGFQVSGIQLENSAVTFRDEKAGSTYAVSDLNLKTGRIADKASSDIDLSAKVKADKPKVDLATTLKSGFMFDLEDKRYTLKDISLETKGEAAGVTNLAARMQGSAEIDQKTPLVEAFKLVLAATGNREKDAFDIAATLPRLKLTKEKVEGEQLAAKVQLKAPDGTTSASLAAPRLEGSAKAFKIAELVLDADMARLDQTLKAKVTGPVDGQLDAATLKPAKITVNPLAVQATLSGPNIPNKSVSGNLKGAVEIDVPKEQVNANLAGTFDQSNIKAKVNVAGFSPMTYNFDVDVDRIDLTRYQPPKPAPAPDAKPGPEQPIDLSALKKLNANGSIRIGSLTAQKIKASNVRIDVKAKDGRVNVDPLAASLYGGSLQGALGVNAQTTPPQFSIRQTLTGINVGPLLTDVANFERLEGRGNLNLNVTTQGSTTTQLKKALNGNGSLNLADGAIKGVNIAATLRQAKAMVSQFKGKPVEQTADATQKTDFSEMKGTFTIRNGVVSNQDLTLKSPLLRVAGAGDIDIGNDRMDYSLKAALVATSKGQGGRERDDVSGITVPVRVTGPLAAPQYSFDLAALATDAAQQALQDQLQKKLGDKLPPGGGDILQDAVKGLFKR